MDQVGTGIPAVILAFRGIPTHLQAIARRFPKGVEMDPECNENLNAFPVRFTKRIVNAWICIEMPRNESSTHYFSFAEFAGVSLSGHIGFSITV